MLNQAQVKNPKDYVVVTFHNNTDFTFTPEMGCMYDGIAINGATGAPGIQHGESKLLPYHVGRRLAINLAKRIFNTSPAATVDPAGIPTGVPIWNESKLQELADTFIKEEYSEASSVAETETQKLMKKVAELEEFMKKNMASTAAAPAAPVAEVPKTTAPEAVEMPPPNKVYVDKQEVMAELERRGIKHDKRSKKADLEKLLA